MINTKSAKLPWDGKRPTLPFHREDRSNQSFYNSAIWQKCRAAYRLANPLCEACHHAGEIQPTEDVDHIIRTKAGGAFLDWANLMGLCKPHHNLKSQKEGKENETIIVPCMDNGNGGLVPVDRTDIFKILNKEK